MQYYVLQTKGNNDCVDVSLTTMLHIVINTQKVHMVLKKQTKNEVTKMEGVCENLFKQKKRTE